MFALVGEAVESGARQPAPEGDRLVLHFLHGIDGAIVLDLQRAEAFVQVGRNVARRATEQSQKRASRRASSAYLLVTPLIEFRMPKFNSAFAALKSTPKMPAQAAGIDTMRWM
jgi:hypothetical protein